MQAARKVSLDELVFAAYLKYPRYSIPGVEGVVRGEDALEWISERLKNPSLLENLPKNNTWPAQKKRRARYVVQMIKDLLH